MSLCWHRGDLDGNKVIIGIMHGDGMAPLIVVRPCEISVISSVALDMYHFLPTKD